MKENRTNINFHETDDTGNGVTKKMKKALAAAANGTGATNNTRD